MFQIMVGDTIVVITKKRNNDADKNRAVDLLATSLVKSLMENAVW
ncbi:hypothetical protein AF72_11185 [Xylella taiwanensis]|uniref:Uncharacterized protein n=1 Tax=Xylella taiwanensis TaxID=1444770 RepID=Z9JI26_9GAMM|nr:hypothetical protein AF72_11185 [Xylella taiwanensis]